MKVLQPHVDRNKKTSLTNLVVKMENLGSKHTLRGSEKSGNKFCIIYGQRISQSNQKTFVIQWVLEAFTNC